MLRIIGVQKGNTANGEFILLQNQGSMRITLRGHMVVSADALNEGRLTDAAHAFPDDVTIPPGLFVILFTGDGVPRWAKTKDGQTVYHTYMGRAFPVWASAGQSLHVLGIQHTYTERTEPSLLLK